MNSISRYRCYTDPARKEMDTLKTTYLVDEEERPLKSIQNYKDALQNTIRAQPILNQYMENFALFTTGDWPTWYFQKKLIVQVVKVDFILTYSNYKTISCKIIPT